MVQINFAQKQVNAKIVYYGPGMSGKTTNLEVVHQRAPEPNRGDLTSISTDGDRTLFFDFMPLDLGTVAGMKTSFQIYTVPGQVYYNSTRKLVLQGVDGVVFVADSSASMMEENLESLKNLEENLNEYGKSLATLAHVIQYNKRDLPDAMTVQDLDAAMNVHGAPTFEAVANTGQGVFPTLKALAASVLDSIHSGSAKSGVPAPRPKAPAPAAAPQMAAAAPVQQPGPRSAPPPQPMQQPAPPAPQAGGQYAPQPPMQQAPPPQQPLGLAPPQGLSATGYRAQGQPANGLQMAAAQSQPAAGQAPLPASKRRPQRAATPVRPSPSNLEGTRFRPRASRPDVRPTPKAKPSSNKLYVGLFVVLALVVGAVLARVLFTFF